MKPYEKTILIIAPYFPPHSGGLERYAFEISKGLTNTYKWKIVVVTSGFQNGKDIVEEMSGLKVYRLSYNFKFSNTPIGLKWFSKIKKIINQEKPALINIHTPVPFIGDITSFLAGKIPVVVSYHAGSMIKGTLYFDIFIKIYELLLLPLLLRRANRIICSSDFIRFGFLRKYLYKSLTVTPATDTSLFLPDDHQKTKQPSILFVAGLGRSEQHKGLKDLINALMILKKDYKDVLLTVVGEGDMRTDYEEFISKINLTQNVQFTGKLTGNELVHRYQQSWVFALPTSNDSSPTTIIEAMACGLPVVSTTVGGIPFLVERNQTGILIEPNDLNALSGALGNFLKDENLRKTYGALARAKIVEKFNWNQRVDVYNNIFYSITVSVHDRLKRILVVSPYFFPKIGGAENYAHMIAKKLHNSGEYIVSVVTTNYDGKGYRQDVIDGMIVHRLPISFKISNTPINFGWFNWIKKIIALERPDIIHAHSPVPFIADVASMVAKKIPFVLTYHAGSMLKGKYLVDVLIYLYERLFLRKLFKRTDAIISVSQKNADSFLSWFSNKTSVISPGVDLEKFIPTPLLDNKIVTFVGRIETTSAWKGIDVLLKAMVEVTKTYPTAKLELVGDGDAVPYYKKMAVTLGIEKNVVFSGLLLDQALVEAYKRSSMVVLPSTSDAESFGMVLIEGMASGRPVIGSNIGGIPFVIEDGKDGILVPPRDFIALSNAITLLLSDDKLKETFVQFGISQIQKHSWTTKINSYNVLFKGLDD